MSGLARCGDEAVARALSAADRALDRHVFCGSVHKLNGVLGVFRFLEPNFRETPFKL
jgi:hypothetical protein